MTRQYSNRPRRLSPDQEAMVDAWYKSARTIEQKAGELGISAKALADYIHKRHKPRHPFVASNRQEAPRETLNLNKDHHMVQAECATSEQFLPR